MAERKPHNAPKTKTEHAELVADKAMFKQRAKRLVDETSDYLLAVSTQEGEA